MGGCISNTSHSTSSSGSYGDVSLSCLPVRLCSGKRSKRTYADHIPTLNHLSSISNRIVMNGKTQSSCIFTQQGCKGINQDALIVWEDFVGDDVTFCGVFDGHGPHGHLVARKVRDALPLKLLSFLNSCQMNEVGSRATSVNVECKSDNANADKDSSSEDNISSIWRDAFLKSFKAMDKELKSHSTMDCFCSGSTAVTLVRKGSNLFMGYIGDSRAIMGSRDSNDALVAIQLTVDLKPDLPREAERIKQCKGRVFAMQDEPEVSRVWLPFDDAPGLAMARAFGDFCLKRYGVISIPEFAHRTLTERDQFIVLASDGVWDVLSNEQVVNIVSCATSRATAARSVVESASNEWKVKYPTSRMDDCAVVCLFLDAKMDTDDEEPCYCSASTHSGAIMESDGHELDEPSFQSFTVRSSDENDDIFTTSMEINQTVPANILIEDPNWLGLDGLTNVNSFFQLPRFADERPN